MKTGVDLNTLEGEEMSYTDNNITTALVPYGMYTDYNYDDMANFNNTNQGMYNFYEVPQLAFVSILCAFIIFGNLCVLGAIRLSESGRKSRLNFFILHLAISDLLVGVLVCFTDLMSKITVAWYAGNVMCKLVMFLQFTVTYASTYLLVSLSIDRYYAVARPLSFSRSGSQAKVLVATAWIASILFSLPTLFLFKEETWADKSQCWIDFTEYWHWQLFIIMNAVVTFFIPTLIIASCYIAIIHIIWSKGRRKRHSRIRYNWLGQRAGNFETDRQMTISESRHDTSQGIIPQAKIRTVKMTLIIVIVFIICWSPFFLYNILELYGQIPSNDPLSTFIQSAAPLNSAANPIIYGIFSTRICKNLRRLPLHPCIRRLLCCCNECGTTDRHYSNSNQNARSYNHPHNHHNYYNNHHHHYNHHNYNHNNHNNDLTTTYTTANGNGRVGAGVGGGGTAGGQGRLLYHHGNAKTKAKTKTKTKNKQYHHHHHHRGSLVVTVNKKGYAATSSKLTQFDSVVLNIDSSSTTNSSDTQLELNSIIKSSSSTTTSTNNTTNTNTKQRHPGIGGYQSVGEMSSSTEGGGLGI